MKQNANKTKNLEKFLEDYLKVLDEHIGVDYNVCLTGLSFPEWDFYIPEDLEYDRVDFIKLINGSFIKIFSLDNHVVYIA